MSQFCTEFAKLTTKSFQVFRIFSSFLSISRIIWEFLKFSNLSRNSRKKVFKVKSNSNNRASTFICNISQDMYSPSSYNLIRSQRHLIGTHQNNIAFRRFWRRNHVVFSMVLNSLQQFASKLVKECISHPEKNRISEIRYSF